jgi:hypothetical protein
MKQVAADSYSRQMPAGVLFVLNGTGQNSWWALGVRAGCALFFIKFKVKNYLKFKAQS